MSDSKGPKVELPDELMAELEEAGGAKTDPALDTSAAAASAPASEAASATELAELKDRYLRLAAEFDNFRRRNLKERQDLHNYANESLVKELLPVVDNLERAVVHGRKEDQRVDSENLLQGVELTYRSLVQVLGRFGVVEIEAEGKPFDPQVHEAVRRVATREHPPGTVLEVYQKGYLLKDRLLRPAMVAVAGDPG
ncbi:MAG: nucleotide exchange factor GrpE [Myxococcota bacterium]